LRTRFVIVVGLLPSEQLLESADPWQWVCRAIICGKQHLGGDCLPMRGSTVFVSWGGCCGGDEGMVASWSIEPVNKLFVTSWTISSVLIEWGSSNYILRRARPAVAMARLISSSSFYGCYAFQCCHCCGGVNVLLCVCLLYGGEAVVYLDEVVPDLIEAFVDVVGEALDLGAS
jgi:hypothetical protein